MRMLRSASQSLLAPSRTSTGSGPSSPGRSPGRSRKVEKSSSCFVMPEGTIYARRLKKRGGRNPSWKERFVILVPDRLLYYEILSQASRPTVYTAKGEIPLTRETEVSMVSATEFSVMTPSASRTFHFQAADANAASEWAAEIMKVLMARAVK